MDINDFVSSNIDNYDNIRGCTITSNKNSSRMVSMFSSKALVDYATKMEWLNKVSEKIISKKPIDSSQLPYIDKEYI